jgi:hypothetical protein
MRVIEAVLCIAGFKSLAQLILKLSSPVLNLHHTNPYSG